MNKYKNVFQNEKYMDDAVASLFSNLIKGKQRKKNMCIWELNDKTLLNGENSVDSEALTERDKVVEKILRNINDSSSASKILKRTGNEKESVCNNRAPSNDEDIRRPPKSYRQIECQNFKRVELQNDRTREKERTMIKKSVNNEEEIAELGNYQTREKKKTLEKRIVSSEMKRNEFEYFSKKISFETTNENEFLNGSKRNEELKFKSSLSQSMNHDFSQERQLRSNDNRPRKKTNRSKSPSVDTPKKLFVNPRNYSKSMSELNIQRNLLKTQVCIKLTDEGNRKFEEFTIDFADMARIKRNFPKLNGILPGVDCGNKAAQYCIEAVNIILRFVFIRQYNLCVMPNATVGVEVLAATKAWEINDFYNIFHKDFLQKILSSSNVSVVFSQASHYGLNDVCDACKEMNSISVNCSTYKKKQKMCFITVSTYIEPLEVCISFHPMEQNLALSFQRNILNTIKFQAFSGSFTIVGFHIQLNNDHLKRCSGNLNVLEIDYSVKNVTEDREIETGRHEKPLRPVNVIYFREHLVVKPNQIVEITVETETEPYLCSISSDKILIKKRENGGEFSLSILSNFKVPRSDDNLYIVGKLLYYVQELPKCKIK